jgi:hypothetical protein
VIECDERVIKGGVERDDAPAGGTVCGHIGENRFMDSKHEGRLVVFSVVATLIAVGCALGGYLLFGRVWLSVAVMVLVIVALTVIVRRMQIGRWSFQQRSWQAESGGRAVEVIFDERWVFLNRLTLVVNGQPVAHDTIWYGTKTLHGAGVAVTVGSGWIGECLGAIIDEGSTAATAFVETGPTQTAEKS